MSELDAIRISVHKNNINRYRRLLRTKLTEIERQYVERRLVEERQSLDALLARQRPGTQQVPPVRPPGRSSSEGPFATTSTVIAAASIARGTGGSRRSPT
jgi:hypothetical protein